jgi:hypothetical protein
VEKLVIYYKGCAKGENPPTELNPKREFSYTLTFYENSSKKI